MVFARGDYNIDMATATALLTVEEFLRLPEAEGVKRELVEGVVREMGSAGMVHEIVKRNFNRVLYVHSADHPAVSVFSETMFVLEDGEAYIPDVSVVLSSRLANRDLRQQFRGAPDLAIEVVSFESASQLESKVRGYLQAGSRMVWVAYPEQRVIHVYRPDGTAQRLQPEQTLEGGELLPDFRVSVSQIFAGI